MALATGLLIRDFFKEERELRYSNQGSIEFSEIELNAYRLSLTIEITNIDAPRYSNLKTLPENTHYGYATLFRGSTVTDNVPIKFAKFRIFDIINNGIWQWHQHTENMLLINCLMSRYHYFYHATHLELAEGDDTAALIGLSQLFIRRLTGNEALFNRQWAFDLEEAIPDEFDDSNYRAYPIASPFPDIVKFKGDIPLSFLFRLEAWYLVQPAVYIVDNPTDTGDETEGEDEYPEPEQGDNDGDGDEFPDPSPRDPDRDPRDYGGPLGEPPFRGGQCEAMYRFQLSTRITFNSTGEVITGTTGIGTGMGPIRGIVNVSDRGECGGVGSSGIGVETSSGVVVMGCQSGGVRVEATGFVLLERVDGQPDSCGDPPPVPPVTE